MHGGHRHKGIKTGGGDYDNTPGMKKGSAGGIHFAGNSQRRKRAREAGIVNTDTAYNTFYNISQQLSASPYILSIKHYFVDRFYFWMYYSIMNTMKTYPVTKHRRVRNLEAVRKHCGSNHWEAGSSHLEAGSNHWEAGSSHLEAGSTHWEAGSSHLEAGSTHWEAGSSHLDAGSNHWEAGSSQWEAGSNHVDVGSSNPTTSPQPIGTLVATAGGDTGSKTKNRSKLQLTITLQNQYIKIGGLNVSK